MGYGNSNTQANDKLFFNVGAQIYTPTVACWSFSEPMLSGRSGAVRLLKSC